MGIKNKILLGIAFIGGAIAVGGLATAIGTAISGNNAKREAYALVKSTEIYRYMYQKDTADLQEALNQAKYEYIVATQKVVDGEMSLEEFKYSELEYEASVAEYNKQIEYYDSDEYSQNIIENYASESEPCVIKYEYSKKMEDATKYSLVGLSFGFCGMLSLAFVDEREL